MPVYEFYCGECHTIFNFLSRRVNTDTRPDCPKCGRRHLERQVSLFAYSQGRTEEQGEGMADMDETQMEKAMAVLAGEMDGLDENDPRQMARLMRKLCETTGMNLGEGLEEAMRRLDAGEDMEKIEEEMGDLFESENPFAKKTLKGMRRKYTPPAHDDQLYPL